jgi:hypothetical protein
MIRIFLALLMTLPLAAQMISSLSRPAAAPTSLAAFLTRLPAEVPTLVLLDTKGAGWESLFRAAFRKEPLVDLFVHRSFQVLQAQEPIGQELAKREGWGPEARWLLLNRDGRVLTFSRERPEPVELARLLRSHGFRDPLEDIRKALAQRSDVLPLRKQQLQMLKEKAEIRTRDLLGLPEPQTSRGAQFNVSDGDGYSFSNEAASADPFQEAKPRDLETGEDETLWGAFAQALRDMAKDEAWTLSGTTFTFRKGYRGTWNLFSPYARISPLCRGAYQKLLLDIEAALGRVPSASALWNLWIPLATLLDRPLEPLLLQLTPLPQDEAAWPPPFLRLQAMREAMTARNWPRAEGLVKGHWNRLLEIQSAGGTATADNNLLTSTQWDRIGQPYVEILLRQTRPEDAQRLLDTWELKEGWKGARARAAAAATACGYADLAARWGS